MLLVTPPQEKSGRRGADWTERTVGGSVVHSRGPREIKGEGKNASLGRATTATS